MSVLKYLNWSSILIGAGAVVISQLLTSIALSYFGISFGGTYGDYLVAFAIGFVAYCLYSVLRGLKLTLMLGLIFSITFVISKSLVTMVGMFGGQGSWVTYAVSGALTAGVYSLIFAGTFAHRMRKLGGHK
jgi:hypothetical protein